MNQSINQSINQSAKSVSQQCTDVQSSTFRGSDSADAVESQLLRYSLHQHGLYINSNCIFVCFCVMYCLWRNKRWITLNIIVNLPHLIRWRHCDPLFSSVQFARINVVLNASTSGPRYTVINFIDAVVAETEKFSEVAGMKRETAQRWHWTETRSMPELLRPEMRGRQVKEPWRQYSVLEVERSVWWLMHHNAMVSPIIHPRILIFL